MRTSLVIGLVILAALIAAGCGSGSDCAGGCPPGLVCYYGVCIPGGETFDGPDGADDATAPPDRVETPPDAETPADGPLEEPGAEDAETARDEPGAEDAEARDDGGCVPTGAEICNAADDDCDTFTDELFPCVAGAAVACTTDCDTEGTGTCRADCTLPAGDACTPPPEVCDGVDNDCDTACDDGFGCCAGHETWCRTWCGSGGTASCDATCGPGDCVPPDEICGNAVDDDCDTGIDEDCTTDNDTCDDPLDISSGGTFVGTTMGMLHHYSPTPGCVPGDPPPNGVDVVFYFDVATTSDAFLHTSGSPIDTVLYASRTCGGNDLGCSDDVIPPGGEGEPVNLDSALALRSLPPGRYYVVLDTYRPEGAGPYDLHVYITPSDAEGDRCGNPVRISSGTTVVDGDTCTYGNEYSGSCGGARAQERVYWFAVGDDRTIELSTCNAMTGLDTVLYLRTDCPATDSELACSHDDDTCFPFVQSRLGMPLGPGLYFLVVDGADLAPVSCGHYQIDIGGL
jgi:hypothetical protein